MYTLNVGLEGTTAPEALKALHANDITPQAWRFATSDTEQTLVLKADQVRYADLYLAASDLNQDCIAVRHHCGMGDLVGPNAEAWGDFQTEYFIEF